MAVGMLVRIPGLTQDVYDQVMTNLDWDGREKLAGWVSHYAGSAGGDWVVFDVWQSQQDFENFRRDRLDAAINAATGARRRH